MSTWDNRCAGAKLLAFAVVAAALSLCTQVSAYQSAMLGRPHYSPPPVAPLPWVGDKNVAIVLIDFQGSDFYTAYSPSNPDPIAIHDEIIDKVYLAPDSLREFWVQSSYGNLSIDPTNASVPEDDIFGPVLVSFSAVGIGVARDAALEALSILSNDPASGFDPTNYDLVIYAHPLNPQGGESLGLPNFTPPAAFLDNFSIRALSHEMGHAIGLEHSAGLDCEGENGLPATLGPMCTVFEYGDQFDTMGEPHPATYCAQKRGLKGWLDALDTATVGENAVLSEERLYPVNYLTGSAKTIRVPRVRDINGDVLEYIYVEFRQPTPFFDDFSPMDDVANGVLVRLAPGYDRIGRSYLLDANPPLAPTRQQNAGSSDAAFKAGDSFADPLTGTVITVDSVVIEPDVINSYAEVTVEAGSAATCTYGSPALTLTAPSEPIEVQPGPGFTQFDIGVSVSSGDAVGCPITDYYSTVTGVPSSWGAETFPPFIVSIAGGKTEQWVVRGRLSPAAESMTATITVEITHALSGLVASDTVTLTVVGND